MSRKIEIGRGGGKFQLDEIVKCKRYGDIIWFFWRLVKIGGFYMLFSFFIGGVFNSWVSWISEVLV